MGGDQQAQGIIYFLHGNAKNISSHFPTLSWMTEKGWHLFILDYRGYGKSEGSPSISGVHQDAHVGLKKALTEAESKDLPLVVVGQSIGGATALTLVALAEEGEQISGLVIDSAFSGYRRIAREKLAKSWITWPFQYPLSWTITDRYSPERHIQDLPEVPLLFLHSCGDPIIPCSHGQRLYHLAKEPKDYWQDEQAGHIRMLMQRNWRQGLLEWLDTVLPRS
ncbi:alpha/beta hydrolase [Marinospirillum celere]|uniref:alpha/beta hydrolase n=1 Tax=Marinospirillum celere TaxID=1122252 RepID=UPI0015A6100C|nr:alpha/beta fold hydrolase [Marinospirillum celere]